MLSCQLYRVISSPLGVRQGDALPANRPTALAVLVVLVKILKPRRILSNRLGIGLSIRSHNAAAKITRGHIAEHNAARRKAVLAAGNGRGHRLGDRSGRDISAHASGIGARGPAFWSDACLVGTRLVSNLRAGAMTSRVSDLTFTDFRPVRNAPDH